MLWSRTIISAVLVFVALAGVAFAHPGNVDEHGCHRDASAGKQHCHPEGARAKAAPEFDESNPPRPGDEGVFHGPLVSVVDGDTLKVKVQGVVMDFRLAEVDAPEFDQPYGSNAKRELMAIVRDRYLMLAPFETDRYGRTVAHAWVGDLQVNRELVSRGAAWFYSRYSMSDSLYHVEEEARAAKRGLWALALKDRMEPSVWREKKRAAAAARESRREPATKARPSRP